MKKLLIIAALAGAAYFYFKPKPEPPPPVIPPPVPKPKPKTKPKPPIAPPSTVKVKASDLALKDPEALKGKKIYAINLGSKVYDYQNNNVGQTLKNEYLGTVLQADRSSNGTYILRYVRPDKQFNKIASTAVYLFN